MQTVVSKYVFR